MGNLAFDAAVARPANRRCADELAETARESQPESSVGATRTLRQPRSSIYKCEKNGRGNRSGWVLAPERHAPDDEAEQEFRLFRQPLQSSQQAVRGIWRPRTRANINSARRPKLSREDSF